MYSILLHSSTPDNKHTEWHPWLRAADARKAILPSVLCNRHGEFRKLQITVQTDTDTLDYTSGYTDTVRPRTIITVFNAANKNMVS